MRLKSWSTNSFKVLRELDKDTETQSTRAGDLLHKVWEMETPNMTAKFQVGFSSYLINWNEGEKSRLGTGFLGEEDKLRWDMTAEIFNRLLETQE